MAIHKGVLTYEDPGSNAGSLESLDDVPKRSPGARQRRRLHERLAGLQARHLKSRLPQGIPIGVVTQVNDPGDALVKIIQVTPLVDLDAFSARARTGRAHWEAAP